MILRGLDNPVQGGGDAATKDYVDNATSSLGALTNGKATVSNGNVTAYAYANELSGDLMILPMYITSSKIVCLFGAYIKYSQEQPVASITNANVTDMSSITLIGSAAAILQDDDIVITGSGLGLMAIEYQ